MKKILFAFMTCLVIIACQDTKVGFLTVEYAQYDPDTLVVDNSLLDQHSIEHNIPWVTSQIEGIEGTAPIVITIESINSSNDFDVESFKEDVSVRGNGVFSVPQDHNIPSGRYEISLRATNEGYSKIIPDVFTIIVK